MDFQKFKDKVRKRIMEIEECSYVEADIMVTKWNDEIVDAYESDQSEDSIDYVAKEIVVYDF